MSTTTGIPQFDLIHENQADWIQFFRPLNTRLDKILNNSSYLVEQHRIRIVYVSAAGVSDQMKSLLSTVAFLSGSTFRYFESLSKTIHFSARFELFKFLKLPFVEVGAQINASSITSRNFPGYLLPEAFSSFPPGFKVVSFYADPETLLLMSYVLRRDSWSDEEGLYQRILLRKKISNMRKYLTTAKRVFVNNIIVTLPQETKLNDPKLHAKNLDPKLLTKVENVSISVPYQTDAIGIIDGQHRVFCYHEGADKYESEIKKLRGRQNLLVTGIVFPSAYNDQRQREFAAKLFLEINDTQARTKSGLKQSIELILNPYSTLAIAKAVVQRLALSGPLKGLLQVNYFDAPGLIKTTSIVGYGLKPLVKFDGDDTLFKLWKNPDKTVLKSGTGAGLDALRKDYVDFCATKINDLLVAAKMEQGEDKWRINETTKNAVVTPTLVNGFIVCLRRLVEAGQVSAIANYRQSLTGLNGFHFKTYKSSQWKALGDAIHKKYFG